jgi:hypothetical protein
MKDLRRTDERDHVWMNPFWMTSGWIDYKANGDEAVFFSFPAARGSITLLYEAVFQCVQVFDGTPDMLIGLGTIATDDVTDGGTVSVVDADEIFQTGDITLGSAGYSYLSGGDMLTALAAGTPGVIITHADATVPVIYATYTATAPTTGRGRLLLLASQLYDA